MKERPWRAAYRGFCSRHHTTTRAACGAPTRRLGRRAPLREGHTSVTKSAGRRSDLVPRVLGARVAPRRDARSADAAAATHHREQRRRPPGCAARRSAGPGRLSRDLLAEVPGSISVAPARSDRGVAWRGQHIYDHDGNLRYEIFLLRERLARWNSVVLDAAPSIIAELAPVVTLGAAAGMSGGSGWSHAPCRRAVG